MGTEPNASGGEPPKTLEDVQAELARANQQLEETRGKVKKYSDEAAAARVARKEEYETKIAELQAKLDGKSSDGTPTPKPDDAEAARLRAKIADLEKKDAERDKREAEREQKSRDASQRAIVTELVAHHKLENPEDAIELLMRRTKLADDGTLTRTAKDKDTDKPVNIAVTKENFEESGLLGKTFWPAKGMPGSGANAPRALGGSGSDVIAKGLGSQAEFNKNFPAIKEAMRGRT